MSFGIGEGEEDTMKFFVYATNTAKHRMKYWRICGPVFQRAKAPFLLFQVSAFPVVYDVEKRMRKMRVSILENNIMVLSTSMF